MHAQPAVPSDKGSSAIHCCILAAASLLASDAHGAVDPSLGFVVYAGHLLVVPVVRLAHDKRHTAHSAGCCSDLQRTQGMAPAGVTRLLLPRRLRVLHFAAQCARVLHPRPGASLGALLVSAEGHAAHVANITGANALRFMNRVALLMSDVKRAL
ncbi:hypothetical protein PLON_TP00106 [Candidatus Tremblaya princeps]|uniref:Uncharacterized protein n=1 Tax=Tremblaya princeps TaxID=189385 RepID=A0A143WMX7_TREPR|nr:hypothetical protein PLON_TP00106 [Candidatus Tremblaya princeps]